MRIKKCKNVFEGWAGTYLLAWANREQGGMKRARTSLIHDVEGRVEDALGDNRGAFKELAEALLEQETVNNDEVDCILNHALTPQYIPEYRRRTL